MTGNTRYHFVSSRAGDLRPESCELNELCPAKHHFQTELDAISALEAAQSKAGTEYSSPLSSVSTEDFIRALKLIHKGGNVNSNDDPPADSVFLALADSGYLQGEITLEIIDGEIQSGGRFLWYVTDRQWGADVAVVHPRARLSGKGKLTLRVIKANHSVQAERNSIALEFYHDSLAIRRLLKEVKVLATQPNSGLLPSITPLFKKRVAHVYSIDLSSTAGKLWDRHDIANALAATTSVASSFLNILKARGFVSETYGGDYVFNREAITLAGGLDEILKAKS